MDRCTCVAEVERVVWEVRTCVVVVVVLSVGMTDLVFGCCTVFVSVAVVVVGPVLSVPISFPTHLPFFSTPAPRPVLPHLPPSAPAHLVGTSGKSFLSVVL